MANMAKYTLLLSVIVIQVVFSQEVNLHDRNGSTTPAVQSEKGNDTDNDIDSHTTSTDEVTQNDCYETKHRSFCECSSPIVLLPEDYRNDSGILHVKAFNTSYSISFYRIHDLSKGHVIVCEPGDDSVHDAPESDMNEHHAAALTYITVIGLSVSMLGMFIHLVVFLLVRDLRNMPGCNLACLCTSMFCAYASFLMGSLEIIKRASATCVTAAVATQFFMLCSFLWMNVISLDIFRSLWNSAVKLRAASTAFECKKFVLRCVFCCGISQAIAILSLIMDKVDGVPLKYRPLFGRSSCWFNQLTAIWIFFIAPAFVSIGINVVIFGLCAYVLYSHRMKADDPKRGGSRKHLMLYSKLALITGMLWLSGLLARATNNIVLWYLFAVLNVLQGFFIFLGFTFTPNVRKYFVNNVSSFRKPSSAPSTTTGKTSSSNANLSENPV